MSNRSESVGFRASPSRAKAGKWIVILFLLVLGVLKRSVLAAWVFYLVVLMGEPTRGFAGLQQLGAAGHDRLFALARHERWAGHAISRLADIGDDPGAVDVLSEIVRDNQELRNSALTALGKKASPLSLAILTEYAAIEPLARMGEPGKMALLDIQAKYSGPTLAGEADRRVWALGALCQAFPGDAEVHERAARELQSLDVTLRVAAVKCQRLILGEGSVPILRRLVTSAPEVDVRTTAAGELGKLGDGSAFGAMMHVLRNTDNSHHDRCMAAFALGDIRNEAAYPALRDAVREGLNCADGSLKKLFSQGDPRRSAW